MASDDSVNDEFKIEALEMLDEAESSLLNIDKGEDFKVNFNQIFRAFHSLKGAAGMFGLDSLQSHMHFLENLLERTKNVGKISKVLIDYFLQGIDAAKKFLEGEELNFKLYDPEANLGTPPAPPATSNTTATSTVEKKQELRSKSETAAKLKSVVVVVDDEPEICELIAEILMGEGHQVHKFFNGKDAIEAIPKLSPDVIFSDINMPELNGLEMIKKLNQISPQLPLILVSAYINKDTILEGLSNGATAFIDKPFKAEMIIKVCENAIKKYRSIKLLNRSLDLFMYQFSDLDDYLREQKKDSVRETMRNELNNILEQRKILSTIR